MEFVVPEFVKKHLAEIEHSLSSVDTIKLANQLGQLRNDQMPMPPHEQSGAWVEMTAFNLVCMRGEEGSPWGTTYAPTGSATDQDGNEVHFPDIGEMDSSVITYWGDRANESKHPVLRARYADLVWDLSKVLSKAAADVAFARIAIDSYLDVIDVELYPHDMVAIHNCERALTLAILISDAERIERVRDAMFALHRRIAKPSKGGSWPFLFDNLYDNRKVALTVGQSENIISSLEYILARCRNKENAEEFDPFGAQEAGKRLAIHYQKIGKREDVERVTRAWGGAFEEISRQADGFLAMTWLQPVCDAYRNLGLHEDAQRVQLQSRERGRADKPKGRQVSVDLKLTEHEIEKYFDAITDGTLHNALCRIVAQFIPDLDNARESLGRLKKDHPLLAMIGISQTSDGHLVGQVGSVDEDPDGRLLLEVCKRIEFESHGLKGSLDRMRTKHELDSHKVMHFLAESPVIIPDRTELIEQGVTAYFAGDYVKTVHVIVPQIEHALRVLLGMRGIPTDKRHRNGTMQEKNLDDLLREEVVKTSLTEPVIRYFKSLLSDGRGFNIRNVVSHGLAPSSYFKRAVAERVIHALLVIGLLRNK